MKGDRETATPAQGYAKEVGEAYLTSCQEGGVPFPFPLP